MKNAEKFKEIFKEFATEVWAFPEKDFLTWLNAEYREPTAKSDLGVDWESYKDADGNSLDFLILNVLQNNFDCGDEYGYIVADKIISLLPSVTPQLSVPEVTALAEWIEKLTKECEEAYNKGYTDGMKAQAEPKTGHWINTCEYYTGVYRSIYYVECSCCQYKSLEEGNYCPNCGAKMEGGSRWE